MIRLSKCATCGGELPENRHTTCSAKCRQALNETEAARDRWRTLVHLQIAALLKKHQPEDKR